MGVAAAAVGALVFAWSKRDSKRSFSLSVQGGSIGILLLVIFSAVKMYGLLSPTIGFVLSVLSVLLAAVLALRQGAKILAVMAIFAGFLAPVWLSDGEGSHVLLFSYYAVLNVCIFILAWLKPWRELNLLGFVFTYLIGSTWGGLRYEADYFTSTQPFVILFFLFYLCIPLRYAQRRGQGDFRYHQKIDAALLFGTPLVTLLLQVAMLENKPTWLALSCLGIGLVYALLAWVLRGKPIYDTLQKAYTGLAVGFITLSVPIGLSAKATTAIFALEGAGAIWLGVKERRPLTWGFGALLQLSAGVAFFVAYRVVGEPARAVFNDYYLSALLIAIAAWVSTWVCYCAQQRGVSEMDSALNQWLNAERLTAAARGFFLWGLAWWGMATVQEIIRHSDHFHGLFMFATLTAAALVLAYRYYRDSAVIVTFSLLLMGGILFALLRVVLTERLGLTLAEYQPLSVWEVLAWGLYIGVGYWSWRQLSAVEHPIVNAALMTWFLALATVVSSLVYQYLPRSWHNSGGYWWAIAASWLGLAASLCYAPRWLTWVGQRPQQTWQHVLGAIVMCVIAGVFIKLLSLTGGQSQWWLPLLNSVDILAVLCAWLLLMWVLKRQEKAEEYLSVVLTYLLALSLIISITWRAIYHWSDGAWWQVLGTMAWSDWHWLGILGGWAVIALLLWASITGRLKKLPLSETITQALLNSVMLVLAVVWLGFLFVAGNASPLPWLPLLNPLAILQWGIFVLMWLWGREYPEWFNLSRRSFIVPALMLLLITVMALRFVYHYTELTWGLTMFSQAITQMALSLVWSILGVISWMVGSKRGSRPIWLLGAVLMSVVLLKLVAIDRGHLGNLFGILSFFAYGVLCVIVGYFAPVPPAQSHLDTANGKSVEVS